MLSDDQRRRLEEILAEDMRQRDEGHASPRTRVLADNPDIADELGAAFGDLDRMERLATPHGAGTTNDASLPLGTRLGAYRLDDVVGRGGMGVVYRATHLDLDRVVAIKVLAAELAMRDDVVARFQREARALAALDHPHIVRVHDIGAHDGVHHFVMDFVDGVNLRDLLARSPLSETQALTLVPKICSALEYAHRHGVVHRDVKPANILIDRAGEPRIADFGLARLVDADPSSLGLTRTEMVMGTYDYMAPEQKSSARVDHRADVYAVGVVLYEMLTGRLPVGRFAPPSRVAGVDVRLDEVVAKALEAEPDDRYQSASQLARDVSSILEEEPAAPMRRAEERTLHVRRLDRDDEDGDDEDALRIVVEVDGETGAREVRSRTPADDTVVASASWVRLVMADDDVDLTIHAWESVDEVAHERAESELVIRTLDVDAPRDWIGDARGCLEITVDGDDPRVYVPADVPVQVVGDGDVTVYGTAGPLRFDPGGGDVEIQRHEGPLLVERLRDGDVSIEGLTSADATVHARDGDVVVSGLSFDHGRLSFVSDSSFVEVGVLPDVCHGRFDVSSIGGSHDARVGVVESADSAHTRGHVGTRRGADLVVSSHESHARLLPHASALRRRTRRKHTNRFYVTLVVAAVFYVFGGEIFAATALLIWLIELLWDVSVREIALRRASR